MKVTEYDDNQFLHNYPEGIQFNFWNIARNEVIRDAFRRFDHGKVLDVGCGRGVVTNHLHQTGIDITGVELGDTFPMENNKAEILYKTDVFSLDEKFLHSVRCISMFDVIEHLPDPVDFIGKLKAKFINAEWLMVTVPARKELWSNFDDYYGHYRRYDLSMVKTEMEKAGYAVVYCGYFFHSLYFVMLLNQVLFKKRVVKFVPPGKGLAGWFHRFTGNIFHMESKLMPGQLIGTSVLCIAKRKS